MQFCAIHAFWKVETVTDRKTVFIQAFFVIFSQDALFMWSRMVTKYFHPVLYKWKKIQEAKILALLLKCSTQTTHYWIDRSVAAGVVLAITAQTQTDAAASSEWVSENEKWYVFSIGPGVENSAGTRTKLKQEVKVSGVLFLLSEEIKREMGENCLN